MNEIYYKNSKEIQILLFLLIFVSPILVLQVFRKTLFLWIQILFCAICCFRYKKVNIIKTPLILLLFIEPLIAGGFALSSTMTIEYKKTAIDLAIMAIPLYISACFISYMIKKEKSTIEIVIGAIKSVIIVEIIWFMIQLLLYRTTGTDINKMIFVDTLHMVDNASFVRSWIWYPSGLSWHSAALAPLFVIGILVFDNTIIRSFILLESFLCGNSTTLLGVTCCFILLFLNALYTKKIKIKKQQFLVFLLIILLFCMAIMTTDLGDKMSMILNNLWTRLFSTEKDASTAAHLGYYSDYFKILKQSTLSQVIFGYGTGCSGYTITSLYGRYANGGTWAIESDYVNILVSRGIFGFVSYYWFLLWILVKGIKIDRRYGIFIVTILLQGFGYNIQFDYLLLIELFMYILISKHINFFDYVDKLNDRKIKKRGRNDKSFNNSCYI